MAAVVRPRGRTEPAAKGMLGGSLATTFDLQTVYSWNPPSRLLLLRNQFAFLGRRIYKCQFRGDKPLLLWDTLPDDAVALFELGHVWANFIYLARNVCTDYLCSSKIVQPN
jgi:hypothetical protein